MAKLLIVLLMLIVTLSFTSVVNAFELEDFADIFKRNTSQPQKLDEFSDQTKIGQKEFHIDPKPYLLIPFSREDFEKSDIKISEGWLYSFDEFQIHDMKVHAGVDFSAPYGTTIYAPADGLAMSSYHNLLAEDKDENVLTYQGKEVRYGLGLFVKMYIPQTNRFLELAHMSEIDPSIPFTDPKYNDVDKKWEAQIPPQSDWVKITKGQVLGKVGTSGLNWGYEDFEGKPQRKVTYDPNINKSWDEPHLHLEEFEEKDNKKENPRDIFGIYSFKNDYPSLDQKLDMKLNPLILTEDGNPLFAK